VGGQTAQEEVGEIELEVRPWRRRRRACRHSVFLCSSCL
jgi:hypothetical protein